MKGMMLYGSGFLFLILAAMVLGSFDIITPAVAEARAEASVGVTVMSVLNSGLALILKLILGATVAGLAGAAFVEGRKLYRLWWLGQRTRRWKPGPNAQYQPKTPRDGLPRLTREDLMLMSMMSRERGARVSIPRVQREERDDDLDLDF